MTATETRIESAELAVNATNLLYDEESFEERFERVIKWCNNLRIYYPDVKGEEGNPFSLSKEHLGIIAMVFIKRCDLGTERERAFRVYEAVKNLYPQYGTVDLPDFK